MNLVCTPNEASVTFSLFSYISNTSIVTNCNKFQDSVKISSALDVLSYIGLHFLSSRKFSFRVKKYDLKTALSAEITIFPREESD